MALKPKQGLILKKGILLALQIKEVLDKEP
jgi:hypothetical protein